MERNRMHIVTLVAALGAVAVSVAAGGAQEADVTKSRIEVAFDVSLEDLADKLPKELMLFRCSPDRAAGMQRKAVESALRGKFHFELAEPSGGLLAADRSRLWMEPPKRGSKPRLPADADIRAAAETFLRTINGAPSDTHTVRVSTDTIVFLDREGQQQTLPMGANTTYRRVIDGYEVVGPGGKIKTFHALNGDVVGYLRVWRELEPAELQPLIPVDEAARRFQENPMGRSLLANVFKVEVRGIELGYLERGLGAPQEYLQPVYVFHAIAHSKGMTEVTTTPLTRYVEALAKPPEPLWPAGREYESGERPSKGFKTGED
jgi:hypothetical protein